MRIEFRFYLNTIKLPFFCNQIDYSKSYDYVPLPFWALRYRPLPFSGQRYPTLRNVTPTLPTVTDRYRILPLLALQALPIVI